MSMNPEKPTSETADQAPETAREKTDTADPQESSKVPEVGGRGGLDPTRYGDWEKDGRCVDF